MDVLFIGEGGVSDNVRLFLPAQEWDVAGYGKSMLIRLEKETYLPDKIDAAVLCRTHAPGLIDVIRNAGGKVIMDLDDDFHTIRPEHPGYQWVGPGNPAGLLALEETIRKADVFTVTTPELAERFGYLNPKVKIIPNGWSSSSPFWNVKIARKTLNIGWAGTITHRQDFLLCKDALLKILHKYDYTRIVIAGDPQIYELFLKVPERQKLFLPMCPYEDYPYLLSFFDILLAPLDDNPFNRAKSDIKLVDAGAHKIPWIASPLPAYQRWGKGGLLTYDLDWYYALQHLVENESMRLAMARDGHEKAKEREMGCLIPLWKEAIAG